MRTSSSFLFDSLGFCTAVSEKCGMPLGFPLGVVTLFCDWTINQFAELLRDLLLFNFSSFRGLTALSLEQYNVVPVVLLCQLLTEVLTTVGVGT